MAMSASWQLWALLSAMFAALTAILAKLGVTHLDADVATFVRTVVILVALMAFLAITGQWQGIGTIGARASLYLVLSGLATGASWICYFRALKIGDAARVAPVDKLSVVLVALFAVLFLGERLTLAHWAGVLLIAAGVTLLALKP
jgi:transporter family protein